MYAVVEIFFISFFSLLFTPGTASFSWHADYLGRLGYANIGHGNRQVHSSILKQTCRRLGRKDPCPANIRMLTRAHVSASFVFARYIPCTCHQGVSDCGWKLAGSNENQDACRIRDGMPLRAPILRHTNKIFPSRPQTTRERLSKRKEKDNRASLCQRNNLEAPATRIRAEWTKGTVPVLCSRSHSATST